MGTGGGGQFSYQARVPARDAFYVHFGKEQIAGLLLQSLR